MMARRSAVAVLRVVAGALAGVWMGMGLAAAPVWAQGGAPAPASAPVVSDAGSADEEADDGQEIADQGTVGDEELGLAPGGESMGEGETADEEPIDPSVPAAPFRSAVPVLPAPSVYRDFGDHYVRHGMLEEAEEAYRKALSQAPRDVALHLRLGGVLESRGNLGEALSVLRSAYAIDPDSVEVVERLGSAELESGDIKAADTLFRRLIKMDNRNPAGRVALGSLLLRQGQADAAREQFDAAAAINPAEPQTYFLIGNAYLDGGEPEAAMVWFRRSIERDPNRPLVHSNLGSALQTSGKLEEAAQEYGRAVTLDAGDPDFHFNLGLAEAALGNVDASISAYRHVLELNDHYPEAQNNQGANFLHIGSYAMAESHFRMAAEQTPDSPVPANNLCVLYLAWNRVDDAEAACREALELDPGHRDAGFNLLQVLVRKGNLRGVVSEGETLLSGAEPDSTTERAEILATISAAYYGLGDPGEALAAATRAVESDPKLSRAHYNLGQALVRQGLLERAAIAFREAGNLDSSDSEAFRRLGEVYRKLGQEREAEAAFLRAEGGSPAAKP